MFMDVKDVFVATSCVHTCLQMQNDSLDWLESLEVSNRLLNLGPLGQVGASWLYSYSPGYQPAA